MAPTTSDVVGSIDLQRVFVPQPQYYYVCPFCHMRRSSEKVLSPCIPSQGMGCSHPPRDCFAHLRTTNPTPCNHESPPTLVMGNPVVEQWVSTMHC